MDFGLMMRPRPLGRVGTSRVTAMLTPGVYLPLVIGGGGGGGGRWTHVNDGYGWGGERGQVAAASFYAAGLAVRPGAGGADGDDAESGPTNGRSGGVTYIDDAVRGGVKISALGGSGGTNGYVARRPASQSASTHTVSVDVAVDRGWGWRWLGTAGTTITMGRGGSSGSNGSAGGMYDCMRIG